MKLNPLVLEFERKESHYAKDSTKIEEQKNRSTTCCNVCKYIILLLTGAIIVVGVLYGGFVYGIFKFKVPGLGIYI